MHRPTIQIYTNHLPQSFFARYIRVGGVPVPPNIVVSLGDYYNDSLEQMWYDVAINSKVQGWGSIVQLCTLNYSDPNGRATNALDNVCPYAGPNEIRAGGIEGNPDAVFRVLVSLVDGPTASGLGSVRVQGAYVDYVMFSPGTTVPAMTTNIFVPLGVIRWDCLGVGSSFPTPTVETNIVNGPFAPDGASDFPMWSNVYTNVN